MFSIVYVINNYMFAVEVLLAALVYGRKLPHRKGWIFILVGGFAVIFGVTVFLQWIKTILLTNNDAESQFSLIVFMRSYSISAFINVVQLCLCVFTVALMCRTKIKNLLFVGSAAFAMQTIARGLFNIVLVARGYKTLYLLNVFSKDYLNILIYIAIYVLIYALCGLLLTRREEDSEFLIPNKIVAIILLVIFVSILLANVQIPRTNDALTPYVFLLVAQIMLSVLILAIQFLMYHWFKLTFEHTVLNELLKRQREKFEFAKEQIDSVNMNAHDMKHKIGVIMKSLEGKPDRAIKDELQQMSDSIKAWESLFYTGNQSLDIVLTEKAHLCMNEAIEFNVMADGSALSFMSDIDIYVLFGNAIDNAIEAVRQVATAKERTVRLTLKKRQGMVVIHVENPFAIQPNIVNGLPQTSKADKSLHGYGIRSIRNIANKYGGRVEIKATDNLFRLDVVLTSGTDEAV